MSSITGVALPMGLVALLTPLTAHADPPTAAPAPVAAPAPEPGAGPRFRFGVGGEGGWFGLGNRGFFAATALGAYLRLGVQTSDLVGLHLTGALSTMPLWGFAMSYARAALIVDFSPVDFFSVGTGFTVAGTAESFSNQSGSFVGVPVALSLYTRGRRGSAGPRRGFGVTVTGNVGRFDFGPHEYQGINGAFTLSLGYEAR